MADPIIGFKYLFGIHMGVGRGPHDELVEIKVGDKTAWRGSVTDNDTITIDQPELFGGEKGEGGIVGTLDVLFGGPTQVATERMGDVLTVPMPGFRRRLTMFFDGVMSMMNPYPKPWKFRTRRILAGWDGEPWYPEKAIISLTRPVSAGEAAATSETKNLALTESHITTQAGPSDPWTITIAPPGTLVSIDLVYFKTTAGDSGPDGSGGEGGGHGDGDAATGGGIGT